VITRPFPRPAKAGCSFAFFNFAGSESDVIPGIGGKREPTCATQKAMNKPNAPALAATLEIQDKSGLNRTTPRGVQKSPKLVLTASAFRPRSNPTRIRAISDKVLRK